MSIDSVPHLIRRLRRGAPIVVVSGLPRSGTSMAMRMLEAGGVPILTDRIRAADDNNPLGYFEWEPVKELDKANPDVSWLAGARGKAVKIISFLLTYLPEMYDYQVLFMERDLNEIVASQQKMLNSQEPDAGIATIYSEHLQKVKRFLEARRCFDTLMVQHREVISKPAAVARRINEFLGMKLDIDRMAAAVDETLYRNRAS